MLLALAVGGLGLGGCTAPPPDDSTTSSSTQDDDATDEDKSTCAPQKVLMCDTSGKCPKAILVNPEQIPDHISRGDFLGPC